AALDAGTGGDRDSPTTWVARAAAWSGGTYSVGSMSPIAPPPQLTAHAAKVAILLCSRRVGMPKSGAILRACLADGVGLAETGLECQFKTGTAGKDKRAGRPRPEDVSMALSLRIENETQLPDGGPLSVSVTGKRNIDIGR